MIYNDRRQVGRLLAEKLSSYRGTPALVLGLARGGVVVAVQIARELQLSADVLVVKKIPSPGESELAIGALAPDRVLFVDWRFAQRVGADEAYIKSCERELSDQIKQKILLYRDGKEPLNLKDKTVIVVDDGAATGATIRAAILWLKKKHAGKVVVGLPVAPPDLEGKIKPEVTELVILDTPPEFSSVGQFYEHFPQVEDQEVIELLKSD